ncbi:MAG TPA: hypothetical protein PLO10_06860 [Rectinema sp.]|jgi:hypothetical protein|nr:hypothetical protein [Spirochaetaceae bacterium]HOH17379.1 hypothetical protein [Rectinema sp.]HOM92997.1 hypothetical protein [Rectinema sp.]HPK79847.1 hypothetical protein [Rectinema sp.]HQK09586.1 hypothetical protein [Rectinema sp.]
MNKDVDYYANSLLQDYKEAHEIARLNFCEPKLFYKEYVFFNKEYKINLMNLSMMDSKVFRDRKLWSIFHRIYDIAGHDNGFLKEFNEYSSFSFFLEHNQIAQFKKWEKPDFILKLDESDNEINLEIRSVISEENAKINKIALETFGRNTTRGQMESYLNKKHKSFNRERHYKFIENTNVLIGYGDCNIYRKMLIDAILEKNDKIRSYLTNNQTWLLIDTEGDICFSSEADERYIEEQIYLIKDNLDCIDRIIIINRENSIFFEYNN